MHNRESEEMHMDMSPMIDLVFLLLIFFMVSSHLIIIRIDKNVRPPTADNAQVSTTSHGRIVVNIYEDGTILDPNGGILETLEEIETYVSEQKDNNDLADLTSRLHVRADKYTNTRAIKKVVQASAEAGVTDVIFGSYVVEKD